MRNHSKIETYLKRKEIQADVSAVKDEKSAKEFEEGFLENYPLPDKVYEHLFELENTKAEIDKKLDIEAATHDLVYNNSGRYLNNDMSKEEIQEVHSYIGQMLQVAADGKSVKDVALKRPLLDTLGIKADAVYQSKASIKKSFERVSPSAEVAKKILKAFPEKPFETMKESYNFVENTAYGSKENYNTLNKKLHEGIHTLAGDFIDIKIREDASAIIERKIKLQLKQVKVDIKVKKRQEERKAAKEKAIEENKDAWGAEQKKATQRKAAQDRLAEKGLVPDRGSKSGKDVHWGDSVLLAAKKRGDHLK